MILGTMMIVVPAGVGTPSSLIAGGLTGITAVKALCKLQRSVQGEHWQGLFLQKAFQIQAAQPSCPILASPSIVDVGVPHPLLELLKAGLSLPPQNGDSSGLACVSPTG